MRQIQRPRVVLWPLGHDFELHRGFHEKSPFSPPLLGLGCCLASSSTSKHPSIQSTSSRSLSSATEGSVAEGKKRMEAAWTGAVNRATDMADSAKRFLLSFRRPPTPTPTPPPCPVADPNPVSEPTPFSVFSQFKAHAVEVGLRPVHVAGDEDAGGSS